MGHGELWCAMLMAAKCQQLGADAAFMDTRDVLVVTPTSDGGSVDVQYEVGGEGWRCGGKGAGAEGGGGNWGQMGG